MAELYTTLVAIKMELNGGVLPAMTPIPESAHEIIDPAFVPGLGALEEHEEKGLRCPVRGCGEYFHGLTRHISKSHSEIGVATVKRVLSIPPQARLASTLYRAECRIRIRKPLPHRKPPNRSRQARQASMRAYRQTVGFRNLHNTCEAQMKQRLWALRDRLGRSPTVKEAIALDHTLAPVVMKYYGRWNAALAAAGLAQRSRVPNGADLDSVLEYFRAWYAEHGELPSSVEMQRKNRLPYLPAISTVRQALGNKSWRECMEMVASLLNIYGGKYGLPEKKA